MEYDIESILEKYEDDYNPGPRPMDQEPRNMYNQGSSVDHAVRTIDPVQDSGNKIEEVLKAYGRYQGNRKGKPMSFSKFFELYSAENFAEGGSAGQLVSNTVDGSRPGYGGKNAMSGSPAQQLGNLKKTQERFKKIGNAFINQDYNALKTQTRKARIATGAKDAGGILNQFDTKLLNDVVFSNDVKTQNALAKNLGTNRKYMMDTWKEALEVTKTGKSKSISQNQLKKIQMQANIFDEILNNKNATVKSMAKKFNISEKQAVKESSKLLNNVYMQNVAIGKKGAVNVDSRGYSLLKSWLPDDFKVTDNFLDNFSNIEGLKKVQSENMGTLIRDAFGKGQNPKKYAQALAGLQEYNNLVNSLPEGLKLDLDHPLSKAFLKGSNVSPDQLLNVTPISSNYNRGFKQSLSMAYDKALLADTKDIKKIKKIEKLAKDLGVNIGKGSNRKLNFGTTSIAKKTQSGLAEELIKNLNEQNISSTKLNELKKTEEGKKLLKEVFPTGRKLEIPQVEKTQINNLKNILKKLEAHGCKGKAAGGRIMFANGTTGGKITTCATKGVTRFIDDLKKGNYSKASLNILKGGGNLIKNIVNPMDLLKLKNLIGPGALGLMAAFEGGVITDDVIRQGTPLNESLANNWLTKTFLPYTQEYAKAKNLLDSGTVPSNMKKYVQDVVTFNESLKDIQGMEGRASSRLLDDTGYGMIDGTSMYSKKQEDKEINNLIKKMNTISEDVITPGTGKALEMKSLQNENEASRMAKKKFSPIFGFDKLKDVRTSGFTGIGDYLPDETPKDLRPITYQDYENTELPAAERQYYEKKYNIKPRSSLSEYYLPGADVNVLDELTSKYNMRQASQSPGFYSADAEKFNEGGLAGLMKKYYD